MWIITWKAMQAFAEVHPDAVSPLSYWYAIAEKALWEKPSDVRACFGTADFVGNKVVFNIGGNKYRLIAVIDYEFHKVFIRHVLTHEEYDRGTWQQDPFGEGWQTRAELEQGRTKKKKGGSS